MTTTALQFDFGKNWQLFSQHALTSEKVRQARDDFAALMQDIELSGKTFLDIGFGQGLSLLIAEETGARAVGCDLNPTCGEVLERNRQLFFPHLEGAAITVVIGSFLETGVLEALRRASSDGSGLYDIVHSWGVLHHTGNLRLALAHAAALVKPGGHLVLALYNRHWTSPLWLGIKLLYNKSPEFLRQGLIWFFYPLVYLAKLLVTGEDPKKQTRGMDFYYNLIDWLGGYPYEYASVAAVANLVAAQGFRLTKTVPAQVPTGCNEFVFQKLTQ